MLVLRRKRLNAAAKAYCSGIDRLPAPAVEGGGGPPGGILRGGAGQAAARARMHLRRFPAQPI